jgi:hypothetical protein
MNLLFVLTQKESKSQGCGKIAKIYFLSYTGDAGM